MDKKIFPSVIWASVKSERPRGDKCGFFILLVSYQANKEMAFHDLGKGQVLKAKDELTLFLLIFFVPI